MRGEQRAPGVCHLAQSVRAQCLRARPTTDGTGIARKENPPVTSASPERRAGGRASGLGKTSITAWTWCYLSNTGENSTALPQVIKSAPPQGSTGGQYSTPKTPIVWSLASDERHAPATPQVAPGFAEVGERSVQRHPIYWRRRDASIETGKCGTARPAPTAASAEDERSRRRDAAIY